MSVASQAANLEPLYAILLKTQQGPEVRAFGLGPTERLLRTFQRLGARCVESPADAPDASRVLAIRADHFYDERLLQALASRPRPAGAILLGFPGHTREGGVLAALGPGSAAGELAERVLRSESSDASPRPSDMEISLAPLDLVPAYDAKLRKHAPPFVFPARAEHVRETERRIFEAAYKGITDFVTKWVFPAPARAVTGLCAHFGIRPNSVTAVGYLLTGLAIWCFWQGAFGLGLVAAWIMTFLDTVDGKLARVTLTSSKLGDVLDHGLDLVHPPIWWAAWAAGLADLAGATTLFGSFTPWVWVVCGGYVVGRLLEGAFLLLFQQEMFTWRPFDAAFRQVIARRNPNLVLLSGATLVGRPDLGFVAVGVWTLGSIAIQCARVVQALGVRLRGGIVRPWFEEQEGEAQ